MLKMTIGPFKWHTAVQKASSNNTILHEEMYDKYFLCTFYFIQ